jgi:hypothetical protein
MSRNIFLALVLLVAALLLGTLSFVLQRGAAPAPLTTPDYANASAWSFRPIEPPKPVWEAGWDLDVFAALPSSAQVPATAGRATKLKETADADALALSRDLSAFGKIYAPAYREQARIEDLRAAFDHYLKNDNRGRAFIIILDNPSDLPAFSFMREDRLSRSRFGGFFVIDARANDIHSRIGSAGSGFVIADEICPTVLLSSTDCIRPVPLKLRDRDKSIDAQSSGLLDWRAAWLAKLETDGDQLAAPIGEEEIIAPSEINSPDGTQPLPQ